MTLTDLLLTRFLPRMPELPFSISRARIEVAFTLEAIARGVPSEVIEGVGARLEDVISLFRAGYAATAFGSGQQMQLTLHTQADGYTIDIADAAHSHLLVQILLRLVVAESQTPPGAYNRLLAALDGDEEAAREAYTPLDFLADTRHVTVTAEGDGTMNFMLAPPLIRSDLTTLIGEVSSKDDESQVFTMPRGAWLDEDIEDGFLSLQNSGVFSEDTTVSGPEPEIFITEDGTLRADGWSDDPAYLAELIWVIAQGQIGMVRRLGEG
ncbi:MAG: hypothetical protein Q4G24_16130 [Paracoccus sp. (in: a-proteobacteria)]|uniref:hypothetical protein n=1 Tax=Paracoccus sp. TaxID=267 RepID=UPI0026DF6382|nr:hypothetical protein [Paracoccus sp. (in: a-proteobacteria)]MDO5622975.1 hypothetical protein [Paracoccus sp. (in: a-proteobacteria)]